MKIRDQKETLIKKLRELFQLDQPDLDFGFYRIMHAKADKVSQYLEKDLPKAIKDAFGDADDSRLAELQSAVHKSIEQAEEFGSADPEQAPPVLKAKAALQAAKDSAGSEADVYDHLYRFFERYYDDGDFGSRRYYTRETPGKAAPFAVPYNGEEVKLHWANADQYYIKTSEYFKNFTFNLSDAARIQAEKNQKEKGSLDREVFEPTNFDEGLKVHFHIVDASEGEHGNIKESDESKRFFIIHPTNPVEFNDAGELVINFEFRADPEKTGQDATWRDKKRGEAVETILETLKGMEDPQATKFIDLFSVPAPTGKEKNRPLLAKYLNQYTGRNSMDYFIHKDLGGFLRRELDFYIKNEVMRLDDIDGADVPQVESYLAKIKVIRRIARDLIDFLAQLEEFQKKLWLKKKFVIETNYLITLDRIPEIFYPEIAANDAQREEWVRLFAIDEIKGGSGDDMLEGDAPGYTVPLTTDFLRSQRKLVLDTCFFEGTFVDRLLSRLGQIDESMDGQLVHSENFQAIRTCSKKWSGAIGTIYIDPPYNSPSSEIVYKNSYKHSSWLSLMRDRIVASSMLLQPDASVVVAIDENELNGLERLIRELFREWDVVVVAIEHNKKGIQGQHFSYSSEFGVFAIPPQKKSLNRVQLPEEDWEYANLRNWGGESLRTDGKNCFYPIYAKSGKIVGFGDVSQDEYHPESANVPQPDGTIAIYPVDAQGTERKWRYARNTVEGILPLLKVETGRSGDLQVMKAKGDAQFKTMWSDSRYNAGDYGTKILTNLGFDKGLFDFPKSLHTVSDSIFAVSNPDALVLDYFAGSGTTGHSVIDLNRRFDTHRTYALVEMGNHFDVVLKPRIAKVIYSDSWKNGLPQTRQAGTSHICKYIRLESYEDALNNLAFSEDETRDQVLESNESLRKDYTLRYMLDVETRGSQSLLNIDAFADPTAYSLKVKKPGSDEQTTVNVDLIETFNWLIGLRVVHLDAPQSFSAKFKREPDPDLPEDQNTRLVLDGRMKRDDSGPWWFRKVEGWLPRDPQSPNNGDREKVLIVWRKLTDNLEQDNAMLDAWFEKNCLSARDMEFDLVYTNGSNNLPNLRRDEDNWKVRLIEEDFMKNMWDTTGA